MENKFLNIGFNSLVNVDKILTILPSDSTAGRKLTSAHKARESVIDCTNGRKTKSIIVTNENILLLSALNSTTLGFRLSGLTNDKEETENID